MATNRSLAFDLKQKVLEAESLIRPHIYETPLEFSPYLSHLGQCNVFLKLEFVQHTGSFKYRGVVNRLQTLTAQQHASGIVTASTGNHGAAFTWAARKFNHKGTLYLPENVSQAKLELIKLYGAGNIVFHGRDPEETEVFARKTAVENGSFFVSPYNDPHVIAGQGTIAVELLRQQQNIDAVFAPIGGGGLMSGIAGYLKSVAPHIKTYGCQPSNSAIMYLSVQAGEIIHSPSLPTLADGTAGGIEPGSITFDICRQCVDEFVLVPERKLREAILLSLEKNYMLIEGAAALSLASFLQKKEHLAGKNVVLVLSGKKFPLNSLRKIIH